MEVYIGAEHIISPLGNTAEENFKAILNDRTGVAKHNNIGPADEDACLSLFSGLSSPGKFRDLLHQCLQGIADRSNVDLTSPRTQVIISTTKGDIDGNIDNTISEELDVLQATFILKNKPFAISNACISGVLAINNGANLIRAGHYDHVVVVGVDVVSQFVLFGFSALHAVSDTFCAPYDKDRKGINLGEGAAGVLLSKDSTVFKQSPIKHVAGTSSNDANHISGPSRTGEGLHRSVERSLNKAGMTIDQVDHISAHGTATLFNDEMESIAFERSNASNIPLHSLKGYFGHTLGAAGTIETAICLQSLRNGTMIQSRGYKQHGTTRPLNILTRHTKQPIKTILKTASGFGGCNATLIVQLP